MKNKTLSEYAPHFRGTPVLYGIVAALVTAFILILLTTFVMGWTMIPEANLGKITYVMNMIAALVGSMMAARSAGQRGWYYGGLTGLAYAVLVTLLGLLMVRGPLFNLNSLFNTILLGLIGGFGGMIGVNLRK